MGEETAAFGEIVAGIDDPGEDVKFCAANVDDAVRADDGVVIWFGRVVAKFFDAWNEGVAEVAAAGDGAVTGLAGSEAARDAGVD